MAKIVVEEPVPEKKDCTTAAIQRAVEATRSDHLLMVRVPARAGARSELDLGYDVRCRVWIDRDAGGLNDVVRVTWEPSPGVPLPTLRADISSDVASQGSGRVLRLEGEYRVPGGFVGLAIDAGVGVHVAELSLRDFLRRVIDRLETT